MDNRLIECHFFLLSILKYVNEVVIGAPYSVTEELMKHFKVSVVCHGQTELPLENGVKDPYSIPKTMGKFISIDSGKQRSFEILLNQN